MYRLYKDLRRILVLTENLLYLAGKSLQRRAARNGVLISLAMSSTIVKSNYMSAQSLSTEQLTALMLGAFASYPTGALLVRLANFLTRDNINAAAGGYLHLTSHYKQSRMRLHLHYLWHEVFSIDSLSQVRQSTDQPELADLDKFSLNDALSESSHLNLFQERPIESDHMQRRHDRFIQTGLNALRSPLPMGMQSARIGFHLGPLEDWYEKGFFAYEDFPAKSFSRDPLIKRAHRMVESKTRIRINALLAAETAPSFWYAFTVRKFSSLLGKSITTINRSSERAGFPDYFDAQHFIWPSDALDTEVQRRFQSSELRPDLELLTLRTTLMRDVFSQDAETARRHVMRMFVRDYAWIFKLRLRFDVTWAAGQLFNKPLEELDAIESAFSLIPVKRKWVGTLALEAEESLKLLDHALLNQQHISRSAHYQLMQVAVYIDYKHCRSRFLNTANQEAISELLDALTEFKSDVSLLHELLHRVRIYHVLIKMQILDYWSIVDQIGKPH